MKPAKKARPPKGRQYTVRGVPSALDRVLRGQAMQSGRSFNQVLLDALKSGAGQAVEEEIHDDLDFLIGTLSAEQAKELESEILRQNTIDAKLWKDEERLK